MKKQTLLIAGLLSVACVGHASANADLFGNSALIDGSAEIRRTTTESFDPIRGQSVTDRARPDFDATPIDISSFQFYPTLGAGATYNSNIFSQPKDKTSDTIWDLQPAAALVSNWGRNALSISGTSDFGFYSKNTDQNTKSGNLQVDGRYDLATQTWLAGNVGYQKVIEQRSSPTSPENSKYPGTYNLYDAGAEFNRALGQVKLKVSNDISYYDYDNLTLQNGTILSQFQRHRTDDKTASEVGYEVTQNLQPFVRAGYNVRHYTDADGRSSNGYNLDAGVKSDLGGIVTAEAFMGYLQQNYYQMGDQTVSVPDFGAKILWNVTELTSVEGKASRSIEETTTQGASSFVASSGTVTIAHELRRDLVLEVNGNYSAYDYNGTTEHDDNYTAGVGARYFINRNLSTDVTYSYFRRDSSVANNGFDDHTGLVHLNIQY
ncbi:MAG: outer membrane beta-barrel protein [Alphaproteobacteria bacterium]|nr:outer membrane beta-barrel protein [Alphaproteobacteria bacterium]